MEIHWVGNFTSVGFCSAIIAEWNTIYKPFNELFMPSPHNSRKYSFTILFFVIIMESMYPLTPLPGGNAPAQEGSISERYEKRCGQLFAYADSTKEPNYFIAAAKLNRKTDSATGLKMIEELLSEPTASARGMFVIYELMAAYLYGFDEIPPELKSKALICHKSHLGNISAKGGEWEGDYLTARSRKLGDYYLTIDTIPPKIRVVSLKEDMSRRSGIKMRIGDNLAGVESFRGTIDGKWILMEYDAKKSLLIHKFESDLARGNHTFQLVVTDERHNISNFKFHFRR